VSTECLARTRDLAHSFQRWNRNIDVQDEHLRQEIVVMQRNVLMCLSEVHRLMLEMEETRQKEADRGVYHSAPSFESRKKEADQGQDGLYHSAPSCAAWVSTLDLSQLNDIIRNAHLLDGVVQAGVDKRRCAGQISRTVSHDFTAGQISLREASEALFTNNHAHTIT
jgi:hypothetical protein